MHNHSWQHGKRNQCIYTYDAISRLTVVTDPLGRLTQYVYDGADNIISVIDANNNVVNYEYNTKGLLTKEIDPLGNEESYKYFVDGLLEKITKADGTTSIYSYDLAGRMTDVKFSDGTAVDYGYNEMGTTTTMIDKTGTTTYQYDDMQRLVSTTDSNDKTVSYKYDILGRKTSITMPDDIKTNYSYDVMDRLVGVEQNDETIAEYEYDANNQLISNVRNDITTIYKYNDLGQIETLTTTKLQENIMQFEYEYDKIGNIVGEIRTEDGELNNRAYTYDSANQLTGFSDKDYEEVYTYDNVGNMLTKSINGDITSYNYNAGNQLIKEKATNQTISYNYNVNGDMISKSSGEKYGYDTQGNLTSIVGNGIDKQYTYNGNGNRLSETTDSETIFYVNDLSRRYEQVLQTYDNDGVIDTYTYGLYRIQSDDETYLYDGRSSVVGAVGNDNIVILYGYTAYSELMPNSPQPKVFGYNGEATDFNTGIQYLRARYYDTGIGRFFQEDDYRGNHTRPLSLNRYSYVENDPINRIDPSGMLFKKLFNSVKDLVTAVPEMVVNVAKTVVKTTVNVSKTIYNGVKETVKQTVDTVSAVIDEVKPTIKKVWDTSLDIAKTAFTNPKQALTDLSIAVTKGMDEVVKDVAGVVKILGNHKSKTANIALQTLGDVKKDVLNESYEILDSLPNHIGDSAKDEINKLLSEGNMSAAALASIILEACAQSTKEKLETSVDTIKTLRLRLPSQMFNSKEEALKDFSAHAIPYTDDVNREFASVMITFGNKTFYTDVDEGFETTVWPTAIKYAGISSIVQLFGGEAEFLHTHPNDGSGNYYTGNQDNGPFSGLPGWKTVWDTENTKTGYVHDRVFSVGDTDVVDVFDYDGIYLVSCTGDVFLYSDFAPYDPSNPVSADNETDLERMLPIFPNLGTKSQAYYDSSGNKHSWP